MNSAGTTILLFVRVVAFVLIVASGHVFAQEFEFLFWPTPAAKTDPRLVAEHEGPCGVVVSARIRTMPDYTKVGPFVPERVFELDAGGKVLRRWTIPVNSMPYAIAGDELLFSFNESVYRVTLRGKVSRESVPPASASPKPVHCRIPKQFLPSAYARCLSFSDIRTQSSRILAYEGACT